MEFREYMAAWRREAFAGSLGWAQLGSFLAACALSISGFFWPVGDLMTWVPTLFALVAFVVCVLIGVVRAPYSIHRKVERKRDELQEELARANRIEGVLVELGRMRRRGVSIRNDLAQKDSLDDRDRGMLDDWNKELINKINEISPAQAQLFNAIDLTNIVVTDAIARHRDLVWHSQRLATLKDFIVRYDAMLMGSRGLGKGT